MRQTKAKALRRMAESVATMPNPPGAKACYLYIASAMDGQTVRAVKVIHHPRSVRGIYRGLKRLYTGVNRA
jgi:hypothetical protein